MEHLCTTTYKLEGDGLEILLVHDYLEELRERGRSIASDSSHLPNVAAILREVTPIKVGLATKEFYEAPYNQWFKGKVTAVGAGSWTISYSNQSTLVVTDENEMRRAIDVSALPQWPSLVKHVSGAYEYLEDRLNDNCAAP